MKLQALTGRVLQSAFNNFAKFTVKHLYLSIFLIKLQAWWCATLSRKKVKENSVSFPKFLRRLALCRTCLERIFEWYEPKKIVFTKSIYRKTPVMAFFLVQLQICGLKSFLKGSSSQMLFYENCEILQNIIFTQQCCAAASGFLWHFQRITPVLSVINQFIHISINIGIILVYWYYNTINISIILVLLY